MDEELWRDGLENRRFEVTGLPEAPPKPSGETDTTGRIPLRPVFFSRTHRCRFPVKLSASPVDSPGLAP